MVVLTPVLAAGLRWLVEAAGRAVPAAAQLPTGCREAAMHALLTCAVGPPRYFTPGWGPCSHCWGWLCVGLLLGVLGTGLLWLRVATHRRPPPAWSVAASETLRCGGRNRVASIGGGSRANTNGTALQHSATSDGDARAADARPAFQHKPSTANVRRGRYGDERSPPQTRTTIASRDVMTTGLRRGPPTGRARAWAPGPAGGTSTARLCQAVAWTPHPHRGKRLGEATHPGPPDIGEAVRRRERAWHALAQMQLLPPHTSPLQREDNGAGSETDAAVTVSAPPLPSLHPVERNSREPWHQWHPARRRPGSARPVHRTRRRSKKPMPSRYPGKMLARRAQCPASATRGCSPMTARGTSCRKTLKRRQL